MPFGVNAQTQSATRLYFTTSALTVQPGQSVSMNLLLDTTTPVNMLDLSLSYPTTLLTPTAFADQNSIIDLWQTKDWNSGTGAIILTGGVSNSFSGTHGVVATVTFKALAKGTASVSVASSNVYTADGDGTPAAVTTSTMTVSIATPIETKTIETPVVPATPTTTATQKVVVPITPTSSTSSKKTTTTSTRKTVVPAPQKEVVAPVGKPKPVPVKPVGEQPSKIVPSVEPATSTVANPVADALVYDASHYTYQIRTMTWFTYTPWQDVVTFTPVASGVWMYQISTTRSATGTMIETFYVANELVLKAGVGVLIIIFLSFLVYTIITLCKSFLAKKA